MPPVNSDQQLDPNFWRSLRDLSSTEEFQSYLDGRDPSEVADELSGVSRRRFMQLMGASITLAGLSSCRWEEEKVLTYNQRPEGAAPGQFRSFATAMELDGVAQPLLVTSFDGRPTKIEGHPLHPASNGAASTFAQASMLGLCDPDRSRSLAKDNESLTGSPKEQWKQFSEAMFPIMQQHGRDQGQGLAVIAAPSSSPTWLRLKERFQARFPKALWVDHAPAARENEIEGARQAFGRPMRTRLDLAKAERVFALESDVLSLHPDALRNIRGFAEGRDPDHGELSRIYVAESTLSTTGARADHRLPLRPSQAYDCLLAVDSLLTALANGQPAKLDKGKFGGASKEQGKLLVELAKDLHAHRGKSVVVVGPTLPAEVHALAHRINADLDAVGTTLSYAPETVTPTSASGMASAADAMKQGKVDTAVLIGVNPVYESPRDVDFAAALKGVRNRIHSGLYRDETGELATWHVPQSHFLEAWGDSRSFDGMLSIAQPLIDPIYQVTVSPIEMLARLFLDEGAKGLDLVKATHELPTAAWNKAVHDGMVPDTASAAVAINANRSTKRPAGSKPLGDGDSDFELVFRPCDSIYDGRFANNGWLQELPDFITKLTWDNALMISIEDAARLEIETGDMVSVGVGTARLSLPAYPLAGQANGTLSLALGYGRSVGGVVAGSKESDIQSVGYNGYGLRHTDHPWVATGVTVKKDGGKYELGMTQEHHLGDEIGRSGREERVKELVRQTDAEDYAKHPDFAQHVVHHPPLESQWEEHKYEGMKWGMAIDLNKCVGCNACVIACQSENNIPVVGKEQVLRGREMHWMRIDRYLIGDENGSSNNPRVDSQPVNCMQCELAPCEQVCPVAATVHNEEGLNDMVYNRCVGTRYCANNCPYKVRRFNYFSYILQHDEEHNEPLRMAHNPEVTVRSRGVMEKCTYCTQRISVARSTARVEKRTLADGDIETACQQTCPADAIVFGDLNLEGSEVSKAHASPRAYAMLGELNIKPRTLYLAMVRNPNPALS